MVEALWKDLPLAVLPQHLWKQDCRKKTTLQALVSKCHLSVKSNPNLPLYSSDPLPNLSWRWPWPFYRDFKFWLHPALFCFSMLGTGGHTLKELVTGRDLKALETQHLKVPTQRPFPKIPLLKWNCGRSLGWAAFHVMRASGWDQHQSWPFCQKHWED